MRTLESGVRQPRRIPNGVTVRTITVGSSPTRASGVRRAGGDADDVQIGMLIEQHLDPIRDDAVAVHDEDPHDWPTLLSVGTAGFDWSFPARSVPRPGRRFESNPSALVQMNGADSPLCGR
jgi:hypothetical protein